MRAMQRHFMTFSKPKSPPNFTPATKLGCLAGGSRIRRSLSQLTAVYSSNRMLQQYVKRLYLPAAEEYHRRIAEQGAQAAAMREWECRLRHAWPRLQIGDPSISRDGNSWQFSAPIYLDDIGVDELRVELYVDRRDDAAPSIISMERGPSIAGSTNGHIYTGRVPADRPHDNYTIRIRPFRHGVNVPAALGLILWQK
jgi:starch phosphorylase